MFDIIVFFFGVILMPMGCQSRPKNAKASSIELPAVAKADYIIHYHGFTVAYNEVRRIPHWVAYELTAEEADAQVAARGGKRFRPDENAHLAQADDYDYRGSGWSRGHMAPAGDFKCSDEAMWDTFYYTNCCPQDEKLNNGSWNVLENRVRFWARKFGKIYVVTGPIIGSNAPRKIGRHHVTVPDAFYKALLAQKDGAWYAIAFVMLNTPDRQRWQECYLTVNDLEELTGVDFFPALEDEVEESVEGAVNRTIWAF